MAKQPESAAAAAAAPVADSKSVESGLAEAEKMELLQSIIKEQAKRLAQKQFYACGVCTGSGKDTSFQRLAPCGHVICKNCIDSWRAKKNPLPCPLCRKTVTSTDVVFL